MPDTVTVKILHADRLIKEAKDILDDVYKTTVGEVQDTVDSALMDLDDAISTLGDLS